MNNISNFFNPQTERIKASELSRWLLSRGISTISTDEIATLLAVPINHVPQRLAALKKRGEIVLLSHNLWIPVPPEYMTWGAPPAIDIIGALMKHHNINYYVGWLSAASLLGSSHHAPQVFQVAVSNKIRDKTIGRSKLQFYKRSHINNVSLSNYETKNDIVKISSLETTMFDIVTDIGLIGGIDNAANLIIEICDAKTPNIKEIIKLSKFYPVSATRRLGYIFENFTKINTSEIFIVSKESSITSYSLLDPQSENFGSIDNKWKLKINKKVEPDI